MAKRLLQRACCLGCTLLMFAVAPRLAEAQEQPIGEAPDQRDAGDIFLRGQRVLLAPGEVVLDVGLFYSRTDTLQLAIVENTLQLATQELSVLSSLLFARAGVLNETEVYAGVSVHRREDRLAAGALDLASSGRSRFGDISLGVRRTLLREGVGRPDIIASFDALVPTDNASPYVLGGGLVFVKSIDPVVLFASSNYRYGRRRDLADGTRLPSGNAFAMSLGYGLALNDTIAISTAASAVVTRMALREDANTGRAENFILRFALTSALARGLYIEPSVSFGLSGPSQSFTMGVTLPYSF